MLEKGRKFNRNNLREMKIFGKNLLKLITLDNWQFETKEKKFDKSI